MQNLAVLIRRTLALAVCAVLLVGCGSPAGPAVTATVTPGDALLAPGQVARFALLTSTASRRQVADAQWSVDDDSVATVATQPDGTALVTAVAVGNATLTATADGASHTASLRVGAQALTAGTLDRLATLATDAAAAGLITEASPALPMDVNAPADLLAAIAAELGPPTRPASLRVNAAVFAASPVVIAATDLTLDGSVAGTRAMTHDGTLELGVLLLLGQLRQAGINVDHFAEALAVVTLHEAGASSGGVTPRTGVPAVTLFPGLRYYNGSLVAVTGEPCTIFDAATAAAIRGGQLIQGGRLTEFGSTVLHELMHVSLEQRGLDDLDDDEDTVVGQLEALVRAKVDMALSGGASLSAILSFHSAYGQLIARPNGTAILDAFGLRQPPAAPNLTAPAQVNQGQSFTVLITLSGAAATPNADVHVQVSGAATVTGGRVVRTNAAGQATIGLQATAEEGVVTVTATYLTDRRTVHVAVVNPAAPGAYVVLDHTLATTDGFITFGAGEIIFLSRTSGAHVAGPEPGCDSDHLHGDGLVIDDFGPFTDPNPTGCGYGQVYNR